MAEPGPDPAQAGCLVLAPGRPAAGTAAIAWRYDPGMGDYPPLPGSDYPAATYNPQLPWGGVRGSPCGSRSFLRSVDAAAEVSFIDLADCRECPMCGGCLAHWPCLTDWAHLEWFMQFAGPGEVTCGAEGTISCWPGFVCELPRGHGGDLHMDKKGNRWGVSRARSRPGQLAPRKRDTAALSMRSSARRPGLSRSRHPGRLAR
jgi:hypothetical protein